MYRPLRQMLRACAERENPLPTPGERAVTQRLVRGLGPRSLLHPEQDTDQPGIGASCGQVMPGLDVGSAPLPW